MAQAADQELATCVESAAEGDLAAFTRIVAFYHGNCVERMDITPDGAVWALAVESDARYPILRLYVVTPEVAARP